LENLKNSLGHNNKSEIYEVNNASCTNSLDLFKYTIKDQLGNISDDILINKFVNRGEIMPLSEMLSESCVLISKLETDRRNIENEIIAQKLKVANLLQKLDSISYFRMEMLPLSVQKGLLIFILEYCLIFSQSTKHVLMIFLNFTGISDIVHKLKRNYVRRKIRPLKQI